MTRKRTSQSGDTPLPGAVMPLADERKLVRKNIQAENDNWSMRQAPANFVSDKHYSDDDDHNQTIPV